MMAALRAGYDYAAFYGCMVVFALLCLCWSVLPLLRKGGRFGMRPLLPIRYRVRLGRRFDPSPGVDGFVAELERYFRSEPQARSRQ
jgi:hypothetical protein